MSLLDRSTDTESRLTWGNDVHSLVIRWAEDQPVSVATVRRSGAVFPVHRVPAVEVVAVSHGSRPASFRLAHSDLGALFRYHSHSVRDADGVSELTVVQRAGEVEATWVLQAFAGVSGFRSRVSVANLGEAPLVLLSVASWSGGFTPPTTGDDAYADVLPRADVLRGWRRVSGRNDWLGEGRWESVPLRGPDFPRLSESLTGQNPRGCLAETSDGTWSTGRAMPVGALVNDTDEGLAVAWQIEHNGPWRSEVGEDTLGGYLALSGPTDGDSGWSRVLGAGEAFETVPISLVFGRGFEEAVGELTTLRRRSRRPHPDNERMPVVFNDYMNTLNGDPTTEKLLPLITAAAEAGAEIFCIDAGWYDDSGHWWDSVGEWMPSTTRFPGGLHEVVGAIRAAGMTPGLWLEPEVVGVRSSMAEKLPQSAFLQRAGVRVVEHDRYHLDLRHPAATAHLDAVVDRLIAEFGIGFFKFDYNINPGAGTDHASDSPGDGLLRHSRAHLAWIDGILDRHPELIVENCASGGMRADFAMLSRLAMQSTSDQQDFLRYPPIAASAPMAMLPEQAASWAYPQPEMNDEEIAFCLVTGLLGRFYVSGYLNEMTPPQRELVAEAISVAKSLRPAIVHSIPVWPLGLPGWDDDIVALALASGPSTLVSIWKRGGSAARLVLDLPHLAGSEVSITCVFPSTLPPWVSSWNASTGELAVLVPDGDVGARTLRLDVKPEPGIVEAHTSATL